MEAQGSPPLLEAQGSPSLQCAQLAPVQLHSFNWIAMKFDKLRKVTRSMRVLINNQI